MARRKKIQSGGYDLGRLVEQSGGMVDEIVHPTLLADNEAHLLKNVSLDEKGTIKTCKGREERFGSAFDANNPTVGIGVFYKSDGTTRLVMAAGTKLYSDTPHVTTKYDSQADWDSGTKSTEVDTSTTPGDLLVATGIASNKTQTVTSQADWQAGTLIDIDTTTSAGDIKLEKTTPDFSDTFNFQAEWGEGTNSDVSTSVSPGDVKLSKEGTDFSETDTLTADFNGTHTDTQAADDAVKLATVQQSSPALSFDGVDDYAEVPASPAFTLGKQDFTVEAKVRFTSTAFATWLANRSAENDQIQCIFTINREGAGSGKIEAETWAWSNTATRVYSANPYNDGQWHHVSAVYTQADDTLRLYIDGNLEDSAVQGGTIDTSVNYKLILGDNIGLTQAFPGDIDEVRYWNVARTQQQIQDNINQLNGNETGLVAYYKMDEGSGIILNDTTANNNDGTIYGATWTTRDITEYASSGTYTHGEQDVSGAGVANAAIITFNKTTPANTTLTVDVNVYNGFTWSGWGTKNSGDTIIAKGTDLTGYKVQWRANLATTDTAVTPELNDVTVSVNSAYKTSGAWTSPAMNPNAVYDGTATLTSTMSTDTSITQEFRTSADNVTWSGWSAYAGAITAANYVQYRLTLATTDVAVTPTASQLDISFDGQYATNGTWAGVSFDVTDINPNNSTITWTETVPVGTSVTVETRGSDDDTNWGAWTAQTSGQSISTLNLYNQARAILAATDQTKTPTVSDITMTVTQDGKRAIWTSPTIDVSTASDKGTGHISTSSTLNTGGLQTQSRSSADNGSTWTAWVNASVDGTLNHTANNHIQVRLIYTKDATIQETTISFDGTPSASELATGFTAGGDYYFATLLDYMCIFNGLDIPKKYDGAMVADIGGSPPRCTYVVAHKNRLFTAKASSNPSRLYFSDLIDIDTWGALSFIDISPNDGDHITGLLPYDDYLIITKQRSVWVLVGSTSDDFEVRRIHDGIGCVAPRSLVKMDEVFAFVSSEGIYASDLSKPILLTERIKETWRGLNRRKLNIACAEFFDHKLRVDVPNTTSTANNIRIIFDAIRKSLYLEEFTDHASCYAKFTEAGQEELLYGHSTEGQVSKADAGTTDAGNDITVTWETKWFNFGSSATEKKARYLYFVVVPANSDVTINVYLIKDGVEQEVPLIKTIIGSNNSEEDTIKLNPREIDVRKFRSLGYRITQSTTNGGVKFHELLQEYLVKKVKAT